MEETLEIMEREQQVSSVSWEMTIIRIRFPVNYLYRDGKIIFHGAKAGHKFDAMQKHDKVSFCVISRDEIVAGR